jgi:putative ABC transport system ATP-binding protein
MNPLVQVEQVSKIYRRDSVAVPVLEQLDVTIGEGEFLALMGPSGSGKSTLLNLLAGLDVPTSGSITVAGEDISRLRPKQLAAWRARHVGFIFQLYNLIPVLTALQNVELPLLLTPLNRKQRREQAQRALKIVGLEERMNHFPRQLSGGQEQRVGIARAIATDPTLILADEPTGDLDARAAAEILDLLERLNAEFHKTIVMVTHDPQAAKRAGRTLHLEKGALLEAAGEREAAAVVP